jgi:hypothetical protein
MLIYLNKMFDRRYRHGFFGRMPSRLPYETPGTAFIRATSIAAE